VNDHTLILSALGQAALDYAARGWHVFPIEPNHKGEKVPDPSHPKGKRGTHLLAHGHLEASSDPAQVRRWWMRYPDANIGLYLAASGLVAVDADLYKPECQWGPFSEGLDLPDTLMQRSARGGIHYIFRAAPGEEFRDEIAGCAGVDVKHKGYILLEPSQFEGGGYRFDNDEEPAPAPLWVPRKAARATKPTQGTASAQDRAKVLTALEAAQNTLGREDWVRLCLGLKGNLGDVARDGWLAFSGRYVGDQVPDEADRVWDSAKPDGSVGLGTVLHLLKQSGGPSASIGQDDEVDLSHDALARDLGERSWDENAKHVAMWGQWLFWDGHRWTRDQALQHMTRARAYLRKRAEDITKWAEKKAEGLDPREAQRLEGWVKSEARTLRSANTVAAVTGLARSNSASVAAPTAFDANSWLLGTPGGTVDLKTGELRLAKREDMITRLTSVAPAKGQPTRWIEFLHEIFDGDRELIDFVQRAAGYALTGETREHKLLFFYGTGRNGKSVFLNILVHILNEYARRAHATTFLNTHGEKHPTDLAGLQGARLVVGSELPKGKSWDESAIKDLTGGDVVTARFMRGDFFDYTPQFTLMIAGNTMPSFKGVDEALRARVVLVPFTVTIPEKDRDPHLFDKLQAEAGQILSWAIEGALQWQRMGLAVPDRVAAASRDYLDGEDTLGQFLADETVESPGAWVQNSDLLLRFKQWCDAQGLQPWTSHTLTKAMKERSFQDCRRGGQRGFLGFRLR